MFILKIGSGIVWVLIFPMHQPHSWKTFRYPYSNRVDIKSEMLPCWSCSQSYSQCWFLSIEFIRVCFHLATPVLSHSMRSRLECWGAWIEGWLPTCGWCGMLQLNHSFILLCKNVLNIYFVPASPVPHKGTENINVISTHIQSILSWER